MGIGGLRRIMPSFSPTGSSELSTDTIFDILRNERRRFAFHYLQQHDGPVSLSAMSEAVAAWEYDEAPADVTVEERHRVYVSLVQSHLPLMAEYGLVAVDQEAGEARLTDRAAGLAIYIEAIDRDDIPWPQFFLGLTGIGLGFLMLVWLEIQPFAFIAAYLWGILMPTFLVAALAYHRYLGHRRLGAEGPPPAGW